MQPHPNHNAAATCPAQPALHMRLKADLAGLAPVYFGLVMATGIVSIAAHLQGWQQLSSTLFYLNNVMYGVLWLLTLGRLLWFPRRIFNDLIDHLRGPGFFTLVAGTGVLGAQYVLLQANYRMGLLLWGVALVLWLGLTYAIFTAFTVKEVKPTLDKGINGAWLLAVVATQSVAVLGSLLAAHIAQPYRLEMNFLALSMWLWGGMLYLWMMSLIFYRYTFFRFAPGDLAPPLLDQHGGHGDLDTGRVDADHQRARRTILAVSVAFSQRLYRVLLGHRHLVDSNAAGAEHLASRLQAFSSALRPSLLGGSVSLGHVRHLHATNAARNGI